jgi:hypothetical protein
MDEIDVKENPVVVLMKAGRIAGEKNIVYQGEQLEDQIVEFLEKEIKLGEKVEL